MLGQSRSKDAEETGTESTTRAVINIENKTLIHHSKMNMITGDHNDDIISNATEYFYARQFTGNKKRINIPLSFIGYLYGVRSEDRHDFTRVRYQFERRLYGPNAIFEFTKEFRAALAALGPWLSGMKYYSASQFTNPSNCPVSFEIEQDGINKRPVRIHGHGRFLYDLYTARDTDEYLTFCDIAGRNGVGLIDNIGFGKYTNFSVDYTIRSGGKSRQNKKEKLLVVPHFTIGSDVLSPNQLSEGTFKTIILLFYLITDKASILLIEEPEVCVHQGLLTSIIELIKNYSTEKQIIISTHSDYVLDKCELRNIYKVENIPTRGTIVNSFSGGMERNEYLALRRYLESEGNLGEYWRHGGLINTLKIGVITEEQNDVDVLYALTTKLIQENCFKFRKFVGHGCGKLVRKCGDWSENLQNRGCKLLIVMHDLDRSKENVLRARLEAKIKDRFMGGKIILIPIEELEAWLLKDSNAIKLIFNMKKLPACPANPQETKDPKEYLNNTSGAGL